MSGNGAGAFSRNKGLAVVESCLIDDENQEAVSNKPLVNNKINIANNSILAQDFSKNKNKNALVGGTFFAAENNDEVESYQSRLPIQNQKFSVGLHHRDESMATILLEKSPLSTQRSKINLNAIMDAYNNLNKHPSAYAFNTRLNDKNLRHLNDQEESNNNYLQVQLGSFYNPAMLSPRDSTVSINPYALVSGDFDQDDQNLNRFVDIFRFSSIQLHHYLTAEHMFQVIVKKVDSYSDQQVNLAELVC